MSIWRTELEIRDARTVQFAICFSEETVDVCLEMFGCLQAERTMAVRKRKCLNKFGVILKIFITPERISGSEKKTSGK